ncbi:MAG: phosphotransferase [Methanopyri archaeon]|nr:phosphotransferase [Methanopyri archaeon]
MTEDVRRRFGEALLKTVREDDPSHLVSFLEEEGEALDENDLEAAVEALRIQMEKGNVSEDTVKAVEEAVENMVGGDEGPELTEVDPLAEYAGVDRILGVIMEGKEAAVLEAEKDGKKVALKVYLRHTGREEARREIVYRLEDAEVRRVERGDAALREFGLLKRAHEAGVRVPEPLDARPGVIVMEYIPGEPLFRAPELPDPRETLSDLLDQVERLAVDAGLVHGDLSAFNVLVTGDGTPYIVDLSEAVKVKEPGAFEALRRDVENLVSFFERKYGVGDDVDVDAFVESVRRKVYR